MHGTGGPLTARAFRLCRETAVQTCAILSVRCFRELVHGTLDHALVNGTYDLWVLARKCQQWATTQFKFIRVLCDMCRREALLTYQLKRQAHCCDFPVVGLTRNVLGRRTTHDRLSPPLHPRDTGSLSGSLPRLFLEQRRHESAGKTRIRLTFHGRHGLPHNRWAPPTTACPVRGGVIHCREILARCRGEFAHRTIFTQPLQVTANRVFVQPGDRHEVGERHRPAILEFVKHAVAAAEGRIIFHGTYFNKIEHGIGSQT